jgi:hypothetical protein
MALSFFGVLLFSKFRRQLMVRTALQKLASFFQPQPETPAFDMGFASYLDDPINPTPCPFEPGTVEARDWQAGSERAFVQTK